MSQQLPIPDHTPGEENTNVGNIYVEAPVTGNLVQIGHGNMAIFQLKVLGAKDATIRLNPQDPLLRLLTQMIDDGSAQKNQLISNGFHPTIAAPCLRAEDLQQDAPFRPPLGIPTPLTRDADQLARNFASLDGFLGQLDQQLGGMLIGINDGRLQSLDVGDLLLQKGNFALWRFRQGALRLFAEQASHVALAEPQNPPQPELAAFQTTARANLDVLRGWMLFQKYRSSQFALIDQATFAALTQGRWQTVLNDWSTRQRLPLEQIQAEWSYLNTLGERYDAKEAKSAIKEAEWHFREVLRRQPMQSVALINLAALLAESALLAYIETGTIDRARLQEARNLLQQTRKLLDQRSDEEGKVALAQCLLYEAISLPPDAHLETVQWASSRVQQLYAALEPHAPGSIRWDIAQRNLARRDPSFFDWKKIEQARDMLVRVGSSAVLSTLAEQWLETHVPHTHITATLQGMLQNGPGYDPTSGQVISVGSSAISTHSLSGKHSSAISTHSLSGKHSSTQLLHQGPANIISGHGTIATQAASASITRGLNNLLGTMAGKIIVIVVVTTMAASSVIGTIALTHQKPANIVGDWNVTYGARAVVTISDSGGTYTITAKSPIVVVGGSCTLPPGTILATFSGSGPIYSGQHGLWYAYTCVFSVWASLSLTLNGNTLQGFAGDGERITFTRVISKP